MEDEIENIEMNTSSARTYTLPRAYTLRNNVARQVAVNFMPSRQIAHSKSLFVRK